MRNIECDKEATESVQLSSCVWLQIKLLAEGKSLVGIYSKCSKPNINIIYEGYQIKLTIYLALCVAPHFFQIISLLSSLTPRSLKLPVASSL